jgi:hypothetical protein
MERERKEKKSKNIWKYRKKGDDSIKKSISKGRKMIEKK